MTLLVSFSGCSLSKFLPTKEDCKFRTSLDLELPSYISKRYDLPGQVRMAIVPYDVQASFASPDADSAQGHYGRELAMTLQQAVLSSQEVGIVELFYQDTWPGKREEFYQGNRAAIRLARNAGFDFVVVGLMKDLRLDRSMRVHTKVIDVSNAVTIYSGEVQVELPLNKAVMVSQELARTRQIPEQYDFRRGAEKHAECVTERILGY